MPATKSSAKKYLFLAFTSSVWFMAASGMVSIDVLAAAGKGAISADRRGPRRQCSVAATGHRLRWNWFQKEKILTDRQ
jgi:hypothetical protein